MTERKSIGEIESEIIEEFSLFDDWMDRYGYLIDIGKELDNLDDRFKTEAFRVKGCQSNVWLHSWTEDGRVYFEADSDAMITRGLVGLLMRVLSGQPAGEIVATPLRFIDEIGLRQHLSTNRSNGLSAMIERMKASAAVAAQPADEAL
jgi:cysteine desulfuration protein SufE